MVLFYYVNTTACCWIINTDGNSRYYRSIVSIVMVWNQINMTLLKTARYFHQNGDHVVNYNVWYNTVSVMSNKQGIGCINKPVLSSTTWQVINEVLYRAEEHPGVNDTSMYNNINMQWVAMTFNISTKKPCYQGQRWTPGTKVISMEELCHLVLLESRNCWSYANIWVNP